MNFTSLQDHWFTKPAILARFYMELSLGGRNVPIQTIQGFTRKSLCIATGLIMSIDNCFNGISSGNIKCMRNLYSNKMHLRKYRLVF